MNLTLPSYTLVVSPTPSIRLAASPANGADVGQGINLSVALAGGRAPFLYQWSGLPMGCAPSGTPWINCTAQTMGLSLVGVNATDSNGVSLVRTLLFTVSPALTTSVTTTSTLLDVGQTVTFGATVAGGTGTYTFDWSGLPAGCPGANISFVICTPSGTGTASGPTTYLANETTTDTNGYTVVSQTLRVEVYPMLRIDLASPVGGATGEATVLTSTVSGGASPFTITWSGLPGGCVSSNLSQITCTPSGGGSFEVVVTVVDAAGARANATVGWSVSSPTGTSLDLPLVVGILVVAVGVVAAAALVWRRRRRTVSTSGPVKPPIR